MLYCWVAAITARDTGEFICTGTLVAEDLVITGSHDTTVRVWNAASGACAQVMMMMTMMK